MHFDLKPQKIRSFNSSFPFGSIAHWSKQIELYLLPAGGMSGKLLKSSGLLVCNLVFASGNIKFMRH